MLLIADGGLSSFNVGNTMDAIMLTKNISYIDGVKLDIQKTLDNKIVLGQNDDLSYYTLSNKKISECLYDYLKKVKFPSHIFKYYIPSLEEVLIKYNRSKIIVLELYSDKDIYLKSIYDVIKRYPYQYIFISNDKKILQKLRESEIFKIGKIMDNQKVIRDIKKDDDIDTSDDILIISHNPVKIHEQFL